MTTIEKIKFAWNRIVEAKDVDKKETFTNELETDGFTGIINKYFVVRFDGTNWISWKDIRTDFYFPKRKVPYNNHTSPIRVHSGFIDAYKSIRKYIHLKYKESKKNNIFISGHSLGGALTTLCAVDIQYNFIGTKIEAVAFAAPRVGNPAFARSFNRRIPQFLRVVNGQDIVTKLPPFWFFFEHVKTRFEIGNKIWFLFLGSILDHFPEEYDKVIRPLQE